MTFEAVGALLPPGIVRTGLVEFEQPVRFTKLRKYLPRARVAKRLGSRTQARDYCFKECDEPVEAGYFKEDKQGKRNDLITIKRKIREGVCDEHIADEHFGSWIRYNKAFSKYSMYKNKRRATVKTVLWFHGETDTGKSRTAIELYPEAYSFDSDNKWWDGYDQDKAVIINDMR